MTVIRLSPLTVISNRDVKKHHDRFVFENPGLFRIPVKDAIRGGLSDPRNLAMMSIFNLVNVGEKQGGGKFTYLYCVKHPDPDAKNAGVIGRIKAIFDGLKGRYGVRRAAAVLRSEGTAISNRKVNRLMQKLGLRPCCPRKKYRSYKGGEGLIGDGAKNWIHIRSRAK